MILFIGHYYSENIVKKRKIPFRNAAGSNRILRIAQSLAANKKAIEIISPGISLWSKPISKSACKIQNEEVGGVSIYYAKTSIHFILNLLTSVFSIINRIRQYSKQSDSLTIIIYNFSIEFYFIALYIKIFTKAKIINNIEDISVPKLMDWKRSSEVRPFQQFIFFFCMSGIARISDGFILPTHRFLQFLPIKKKPFIIVTGCFTSLPIPQFKCKQLINILFSGKVEFEHGIDILINAMKKLHPNLANRIKLNICGDGSKTTWLKEQLSTIDLEFVSYRGFLTDIEYNSLMKESDICLVLQNPIGRYANLKTPSKFYEYYANGKCVIASDVGDYHNLPNNSFLKLDLYSTEGLNEILKSILPDKLQIEAIKHSAYNYARYNFGYSEVGNNIIKELGL